MVGGAHGVVSILEMCTKSTSLTATRTMTVVYTTIGMTYLDADTVTDVPGTVHVLYMIVYIILIWTSSSLICSF